MNFSGERWLIFRNKYFLAGLLIKFLCLFVFGSEYLHNYFIPFIDNSLLQFGDNPWSLSPPEYFPYGAFLYLCLIIPKGILFLIFGESALSSTVLSLFGIKIVLLAFDTLLFWVLTRWALRAGPQMVFYYWLNPILFYITYVYGQLDVVSISLLATSLFLLFKNKIHWASLLFGLAIASKFHVIIVAPFIAAYIWNRFFKTDALKKLIQSSLIVLASIVFGFLPVALSSHFDYATTGSPEAQRVFAAKIIFNDESYLYVGLLLLFLVLGRLIFSTKITQRGLVYGCGLLLGVLLLITNPMPGWYFWVIPFLSLFYVHYPTAPKLLLLAIVLAYFSYFVLAPQLQLSLFLNNLSLTLLQTALLSLLLALYHVAIKAESPLKNRLKPLLIGLSGDSGAGKNHLTSLMQNILGLDNCIMIEGDNYHKWERGNKNWDLVTHLNPQANDLSKLREHTESISKGQAIEHHHYDHSTGKFTQSHLFAPAKSIVIQGLHSLYLKGLRESLDLKIFLNPSEKVRLYWKIKRDVMERGHSLEKVLSTIEKRKSDSLKHIQPQKEKSDWTIELDSLEEFDPTDWKNIQSLPLLVKYTLYNDENISELVDNLRLHRLDVSLDFQEDNFDKAIVKVSGSITADEISNIAHELFPDLRSLTRNREHPVFVANLDGVHQLFFLCFLKKRIG